MSTFGMKELLLAIVVAISSSTASGQSDEAGSLRAILGREPQISTFNVGPDFWSYLQYFNETELGERSTLGWQPFAAGDLWVIYFSASDTDSQIQLPDMVQQVLAVRNADLEGEIRIFYALVTVENNRQIGVHYVNIDSYRSTNRSLRQIDCSIASSVFNTINGDNDASNLASFAECDAMPVD